MCKRSDARRVPPRHCRHQGEHAPHESHDTPRRRAGTDTAGTPLGAPRGRRRRATSRRAPTAARAATTDVGRDGRPAVAASRHARTAGHVRGCRPHATGCAQTPATDPSRRGRRAVRHVVAQPHRAGEQIRLEAVGRGPAVAGCARRLRRRGACAPEGVGRDRPRRRRPRGSPASGVGRAGHGGEETGVGRPVPAGVARSAVTTAPHPARAARRRRRRAPCGGRPTGTRGLRGAAPSGIGESTESGARRRPTDANWASRRRYGGRRSTGGRARRTGRGPAAGPRSPGAASADAGATARRVACDRHLLRRRARSR